jgi:hypothetical protein
MSDGSPYADFADARKMGGSYGPDSKMDTALAAYTPNTPWAQYACTSLIGFDGAGTSADCGGGSLLVAEESRRSA